MQSPLVCLEKFTVILTKQINTYDVETFFENNSVVPYCVCFNILDEVFSFYYKNSNTNIILESLEKIAFICLKKKINQIDVYVHNINFDGVILIEVLSLYKIKYEIFAQELNIYYIKIQFSNVQIKFRCSFKIIPISLKKLGELEGFKKTLFPYNFVSINTIFYKGTIPSSKFWDSKEYLTFFENNFFDLKNESIKYCINDVNLLKIVLSRILPIYNDILPNVTNSNFSTPSISNKIFFKKYNVFKVDSNINLVFDDYIRRSYYGGRSEVFGNIEDFEHIKYFDFSGMYAQCMKEDFHIGEGKFSNETCFKKAGFYNIKFYSNMFIPVLPIKINGKLMFLNGIMEGVYWWEEIILFLEMGGEILEIKNAFVYENIAPVFDDFIENFKKIREKGGYFNVIGKLIINSLYGSFGLRNEDSKMIVTFSDKEFNFILKNLDVINHFKINDVGILNIAVNHKFKLNYNKLSFLENGEFSKRNVSYASSISSKARVKLYRAIQECLNDGGRLLYTDTDSIFAAYNLNNKSEEFYNKKWLDFYQDGVFVAPKTYAIKKLDSYEIKIKGFNNLEINFEDFKKNFYLENKIELKDQLNFSKFNFVLERKKLSKNLNFLVYDKRKFVNEKKHTIALNIKDIQAY